MRLPGGRSARVVASRLVLGRSGTEADSAPRTSASGRVGEGDRSFESTALRGRAALQVMSILDWSVAAR